LAVTDGRAGGWQSGVSNAIQAKSNQIKRGPKILQEITERTFNRLFNSGKLFLHHSAPIFAPFAGAPVANQRLTIGNCTMPERQDYRPSFPSFAYVRGEPSRAFPHHAPCVQAQSTLQSNLVKPRQTWSNLVKPKIFSEKQPPRTTHHRSRSTAGSRSVGPGSVPDPTRIAGAMSDLPGRPFIMIECIDTLPSHEPKGSGSVLHLPACSSCEIL